MPELDNSLQTRHAEIVGQEIDLEIPVLETIYHDLDSLRNAYNKMSENRNELQAKLDAAVEFSNIQTKQLELLQNQPSDSNDLKALLRNEVQRNNHLGLEIQHYQEEIQENELKIESLEAKLVGFENIRTLFKQAVEEKKLLRTEFDNYKKEIAVRIKELEGQVIVFKKFKDEMAADKNKLEKITAKYQEQKIELTQFNDLRSELHKREEQLVDLKQTLEEEYEQMHLLENQVNNTNRVIQDLENRVKEANTRIPSLEDDIRQRDLKLSKLISEVKEKDKHIDELETSLKLRETKVSSLEDVLDRAKEQVVPLKNVLNTQDSRIRELEELLHKAMNIVPIDSGKAEVAKKK